MFFKILMSLFCGLIIFNSTAMRDRGYRTQKSTRISSQSTKTWKEIDVRVQEVIIQALRALMNIKDKTSDLKISCQNGKVSRLQHIIDRHQTNKEKRPNISQTAISRKTAYATQAVNILASISDVSWSIVHSGMLRNPEADVWLKKTTLRNGSVELQVAIPMPSNVKVPVLCPVLDGKWKVLEAKSFCLQFFVEHTSGTIEFSSAYFQTWKENETECNCGCRSKIGHNVSDDCLQLPDYTPYLRRISVVADGDCGYTALGISRQGLGSVLRQYLQDHPLPNDPIRRELQWQLDNIPANDRAALEVLGGVSVDNYILYFIEHSAANFQGIGSINRHNSVPGEINRWVNYLNLGDGTIPGVREEQHGLGVVIATLLNRRIIVHVEGTRMNYQEIFSPIPDIASSSLTTTRTGESIGLFNMEGEAHFDILDIKDEG